MRVPALPFRAIPLLLAAVALPSALDAQDRDAGGGPVSPDSAALLRAALQRPPPKPPSDAVDAIGLPFRIAVFPLRLVGSGLADVVGVVTIPGPPTFLDRALRDLDRLGFRPSIGTIGPRSGLAARLAYLQLEPAFAEAAISLRGSQRQRVGLRAATASTRLEVAYTFQRNAEPHFWGIGPGTKEGDRTDYLWDRQEAGVRAAGRSGPLDATVGAAYEDNRVARGFDNGTPDLQTRFDADTLFGAADRTRFVRLDGGASLNLTRPVGFQTRGVYLQLQSSLFLGAAGTDSDFHRIGASAHGYLPLNDRQVLVVRGVVELNRADRGRGLPFTHLASLGDRWGARAYPEGRFRDRDAAAVTLEWRYEVWRELHGRARVEGFVFLDEGGVAPRPSRFATDALVESHGFGMRVVSVSRLRWLGYVAFGEEGARFQAGFEWGY